MALLTQASLTQGQVLQIWIMASFLGLIPGYIAARKGRRFGLWWIYGTMIFIVALIHSLLIKPRVIRPAEPPLAPPPPAEPSIPEGTKICPNCGQLMDEQAAKCPVCKEPQPVSKI